MKYILSFFLCLYSTYCFGLPDTHRPIMAEGIGRPLQAWVEFCANEKYRDECEFGADEPKRIVLTEEIWFRIVAVNHYVNRITTALTDPLHWGASVIDRWDLAEDGFGDCEDHQLLKRKLLASSGIPRRAMRMTLVIANEGHAVLMVKTDHGDFILDNLTDRVLSWDQTTADYVYISQEGQDSSTEWVKLHPRESLPQDAVASNRAVSN